MFDVSPGTPKKLKALSVEEKITKRLVNFLSVKRKWFVYLSCTSIFLTITQSLFWISIVQCFLCILDTSTVFSCLRTNCHPITVTAALSHLLPPFHPYCHPFTLTVALLPLLPSFYPCCHPFTLTATLSPLLPPYHPYCHPITISVIQSPSPPPFHLYCHPFTLTAADLQL